MKLFEKLSVRQMQFLVLGIGFVLILVVNSISSNSGANDNKSTPQPTVSTSAQPSYTLPEYHYSPNVTPHPLSPSPSISETPRTYAPVESFKITKEDLEDQIEEAWEAVGDMDQDDDDYGDIYNLLDELESDVNDVDENDEDELWHLQDRMDEIMAAIDDYFGM